MARSDNPSRKNRGGRGLDETTQRKQDQEEQVEQQVEVETEQTRDTQQDKLGNQGVAAMLGSPTVAPGSAGRGVEAAERESSLDLDFGGDDDDIPVDGPQTIQELAREWNKGTPRGQDITAFSEPMPSDDLPPEDRSLREVVTRGPIPRDLPTSSSIDPLLMPTDTVVAGDLTPWMRAALSWADRDLAARALTRAISPIAPCLHDPAGRVAYGRARAAAIATLLAADGPALRGPPDPARSSLVHLCLELAGQRHTVQQVWWRAQRAQIKLPVGRALLEAELAGRRPGLGRRRTPNDAVSERLMSVLRDLVDLPSATALVPFVPDLQVDNPDDDEDPLGIDAVLGAHTGGAPDPLASIYEAAQHAAERIASATARSRVRFAGLARAVCEVADDWTAGAPVLELLKVVDYADQESKRVLDLLVEISIACRRRAVDPQGVRNGLRRAARMLDKVVTATLRAIRDLVAGLLPAAPTLEPEPPRSEDDPLAIAWADGRPQDALPWLDALPTSLSRDAARAFTAAGAHAPSRALLDALLPVINAAESARPALADAARVLASSAAIWSEDWPLAASLGGTLRRRGRARRHGLLMVCGALAELEALTAADDLAEREALRLAVARDVWAMGQRGPLTLLLRWQEPTDDA